MKFKLVFDKSGDEILLETKYNSDLLEFFVNKANQLGNNLFTDDSVVNNEVTPLLNDINSSLSKTNEIFYTLTKTSFRQNDNLLDYLDQEFLNQQHEDWVFSQQNDVDIDCLRFSKNSNEARIGTKLHDMYPDDIRVIKVAEALIKLGYIFPYEEVNLTVHRLEKFFTKNIEFKSNSKWEVFENPYVDNFISNNDIVNFKFGYTYVGRQYYDKWHYFDTELKHKDHYNYETLEWAFQFNLDRPQTIAYSPEFLNWCNQKNVKPITTQIPIGNVVDLEKNLQKYRTMLYNNSRNSNHLSIVIN
jgi:hypothetical protein